MAEVGFAIVGCGNIAPIHARSIAEIEGTRLVAVADVVEENAAALAGEYGAEAYADYGDLLARADVHAVSLCIPTGMRLEVGEACAKAGKHVLSEKPLEVTVERIDRLVRATEAAGVKLGCVFQGRFAEGPQAVRRAVEEGRFGRLVLGDAYIKWYRSQAYYDSGGWRGTRALDGGGALMNQGIHQIDLLQWFMGPARSVYARTALVAHSGLEVEDLACAIIEFENGAMGVVEGSTAIWPGHPARVEVHGTEGSAVIEDGRLVSWQFKEEQAGDREIREALAQDDTLGSGASDPIGQLSHEGHKRQIADFVEAIREDRPPVIDGREGRIAVALVEAIYASAECGGAVEL